MGANETLAAIPSASQETALMPGVVPSQQWIFELRPSNELPVVDLSISVRSRFLQTRAFAALSAAASYWKALSIGLFVHLIGYPISIATHPHQGRVLAVFCAMLATPAVIINCARLRYDIVVLLLGAYDSIFFMIVAVTTFSVLAAILGDARGITLIVMTAALLPNIFVDADLRVSRFLKVISITEIIAMIIIDMEVLLDLIPDARSDLLLLRYRDHVLPAKLFVLNGLSSLTILLLRNVYHRSRQSYLCRTNRVMYRCITYRAKLHLRAIPRDSSMSQRSFGTRRIVPFNTEAPTFNTHGTYQQLYYDRSYQVIDTRKTVLPVAFRLVVMPTETPRGWIQQEKWVIGFHVLASAAFFSSVLALPIDMWLVSRFYHGRVPIVQSFAFSSTMIHLMSVMALSQRDILFAVFTSFNFLYLSTHILALGLCMCDLFRWDSRCLMIAILCAWLEASMCIDALTPPVRDRLQINIRGTAFLLGLCSIVSVALVAYILVFSTEHTSNNRQLYDRVIWTARVFGESQVQVSVVPVFYSLFATALLLMLRVVFRAATYSNIDLVIIDGPVIFFNSLQGDEAKICPNTHNHQSSRRLRVHTPNRKGSAPL